MKTEIITIGDEILQGTRVNRNAAYLGERLTSMGAHVLRSTTVADDTEAIEKEVRSAMSRADLVVTTGGLGVTADDKTRQAIARVVGRKLVLDEDLLARVRDSFERRGQEMPEINISQAMIPEGARAIENRKGTAAGLLFERGETLLFVLPGPPHELRPMFERFVSPFLEGSGLRRLSEDRLLRTTGLSESEVAERVAQLVKRLARTDVAYLPHVAGVDIRITGRGNTRDEAAKTADSSMEKLAAKLEPFVYARGNEPLEKVVGYMLSMQRATLAVAESCTGGQLGGRITRIPGSSDYFAGGVIAYSDDVKKRVLKVKAGTLKAHGAVSEETAVEMANGVRSLCRTDYGVSITGIAGPGGGVEEKPVGTVHVAVVGPDIQKTRAHKFPGSRNAVRRAATQSALDLLRRALMSIEDV